MRGVAFALALIVLSGCGNESMPSQTVELTKPQPNRTNTRIVVDSCYQANGEFTLTIDGSNVPVLLPHQRDDSIGICADTQMGLGNELEIELSGTVVFQTSLSRVEGKALVVSIANSVRVEFEDEDQLLYD